LAKSFLGASRLKNHRVFIQGEAKKATGKATPTKYLNGYKNHETKTKKKFVK